VNKTPDYTYVGRALARPAPLALSTTMRRLREPQAMPPFLQSVGNEGDAGNEAKQYPIVVIEVIAKLNGMPNGEVVEISDEKQQFRQCRKKQKGSFIPEDHGCKTQYEKTGGADRRKTRVGVSGAQHLVNIEQGEAYE
jgi:hypothetical protein